MNHPTRRDVLKQLGSAGAGFALAPTVIRGQGTDTHGRRHPGRDRRLFGQPEHRPNHAPADRERSAGGDARRRRAGASGVGQVAGARAHGRDARQRQGGRPRRQVRRESADIDVEGADLPVQEFTLDAAAPGISFLLPQGPLLGLGEGGAQFDRKGSTDQMRNGQVSSPNTPSGYRLAMHGTRAPIQWLVGTDGWALFIHQPYGAFDFTGDKAVHAARRPNAIDVFVVASTDPAGHHARVRAHHRAAGNAGAVDVRLPAVASHARRPRRDPGRRARRCARRNCRATR